MQASPNDPIHLIPGCGSVNVAQLQARGIHNFSDLSKYKGDDKSVLKFQKIVNRQIDTRRRVTKHSWQGRVAHVMRQKSVTRVEIGDMLIAPHRIVLTVSWSGKRKDGAVVKHRKTVSPASVMAMHVLWWRNDVFSDKSSASEDEESSDDSSYHHTCRPMDESSPLPLFIVQGTENFTQQEILAIQAVQKEVNELGQFVFTEE